MRFPPSSAQDSGMTAKNKCWGAARTRLVLIVLASTFPIVGCTGLKKLRPAFETNQKNIAELQANVSNLITLLEITGHGVIDMQTEVRRTALCVNMQESFSELGLDPTKVTEQSVDALLHDPTKVAGKRYLEFSAAMAAAEPRRRKELQLEQPIFAARLNLDVTSQKIADDYAMLLNASKSQDVARLRRQIADTYPAVKELISTRIKFDSDIAQYRKVVVQNQLGLALEHADLFNYASESNLNVEKAFAAIIGDKGLQTKILGYVTDEKTKSALEDSFDFITSMIGQSK